MQSCSLHPIWQLLLYLGVQARLQVQCPRGHAPTPALAELAVLKRSQPASRSEHALVSENAPQNNDFFMASRPASTLPATPRLSRLEGLSQEASTASSTLSSCAFRRGEKQHPGPGDEAVGV